MRRRDQQAIRRALTLAESIVQGIAQDERAEHRRGPGRQAETAIGRALRILDKRQEFTK